jgi:hypothetical protein
VNVEVVVYHNDVTGLQSLWAALDRELDALPFVQRAVTLALDRGEVDENIFAPFARNESIALRGIEPLDGSLDSLYHVAVSP